MPKILSVSPDLAIASGRVKLLSDLDVVATVARSVSAAQARLQAGLDSGAPYDLLVVDLEEDDEGRTGLDLCGAVADLKSPPLRLLLIWPEEAERGERALAEGKVSALLSRQDGWRQFRPTVEKLLRKLALSAVPDP